MTFNEKAEYYRILADLEDYINEKIKNLRMEIGYNEDYLNQCENKNSEEYYQKLINNYEHSIDLHLQILKDLEKKMTF